MITIQNDQQLMSAIMADLDVVLDDINKDIIKIIEVNIRDIVYAPYTSKVRAYERRGMNGGFLGSWRGEKMLELSNQKTLKIFSDPERMDLDPPVHGKLENFLETSQDIFADMDAHSGDRREIMDAAIAEGTDWDFYVQAKNDKGQENPNYLGKEDNWWTRPRDYWSISIEIIEGTNLLEKAMKKRFRDLTVID